MDKLIPRNNTSFIKNANEVIKSIQQDKNDPLKYHQRLIHEYLLNYPHIRGILAYWEMGAGKTILAVSLVDSIIKRGGFRKILFISSKTLHGNFIGDYKKYLKLKNDPVGNDENEAEEYIEKNCQFITLTANNMLQQVYRKTGMEGEEVLEEGLEDLTADSSFDFKKFKEEMKKLNVLGNLDNTFVIIDEAHNFFNGITNGSKNYVGLYQLIMEAKNIKLLFLSGSPITNDPFEIGLCFNMLNGYFEVKSEQLTLFGEEYDDFRKYFVLHPYADLVDSETTNTEAQQVQTEAELQKVPIPIIKNKDKFSNRIVGLVSYYGTDQAEIRELFPTIEEPIIQKVPMSTKQYAAYAAARDKEQEETKRGIFRAKKKTLQKPQGASSSYRVRSRQISNFLYPKYASKTYKDEKGFIRYDKFIDQLKPEYVFRVLDEKSKSKLAKPKPEKIKLAKHEKIKPEKIKKGKGEENEDEDDFGLETWSPKMVQIMVNLSIHLPKGMLDNFKELAKTPKWMPELIKRKSKIGVGPGVVYSQFIDSGIGLLGRILEFHGMKEIKSISDLVKIGEHKGGTFAIISGEVDPELRAELVKLAMSADNKKGELLSLLLITATGAEGVNTRFMKHVHAIEPFWHWSRLAQVFARAARLGSHTELSEDERTVQPYLYLSDYPKVFEDKEQMKIKSVEDTTDVTLYFKAIQNQILINSFLRAIKEASIDCVTHYSNDANNNKNNTKNDKLNEIKCKICSPTNEPLFILDLDKDMKSVSPCQELKEEKIKAQSVILEDANGKREFMFYIDADDQIHILEFNSQLNAYQEIFENHPDYFSLYDKITKKEIKSQRKK